MTPFNWFNRQFNEQPQSEAAESPVEEAAEETVKEQSEETTSTEPAINQDYLSWAKAAYANIQKQQAAEPAEGVTEEATEEAIEEPSAEPVAEKAIETEAAIEAASEPAIAENIAVVDEPAEETTANEEEVTAESEAVVTETAIAEPVAEEPVVEEPVAEEPVTEEPVTEASVTEEHSADVEAPVAEELATEEPVTEAAEASALDPVAPLPFWAQAEAERLERLERLRAEAIVEPEPTPPPAAEADTTSTIPDFVLDEAFLWSAEVLASQGRRPDQVSIEEITWLNRLRQGLDKTRRNLVNQLRAIVGQGPLNQDAVMEIESLLLQADVGIEATDYIVESLQNRLREEVLPPAEAIAYLKQLLREMLDTPLGDAHALTFVPEKDTLNIWLVTGVNGAGKTTTIGKIAHIAQKSGYRCLIAAADTFRAAAVQQVKVWGDRSNVEVIANPGKNTDPAAVVFDAIAAAQSRNTELLIVDTAGRLQNKKNLMDELSKIRRIIDKKAPNARVESLLVLDSTLGQNGLRQAEVFSEAAQLSGVVLTKLDGTAKGGIALAVVKQLDLPIRFIGAGEGIEDLRPFSSYEFVEALLNG
jgi:fused signal recognition particle receptor